MTYELKDIAEYVMFGVVKTEKDLQDKIEGQWEYRKGKSIVDINTAVKKGIKLGMGKTEDEIDCVAMYLGYVFKKVRKKKN